MTVNLADAESADSISDAADSGMSSEQVEAARVAFRTACRLVGGYEAMGQLLRPQRTKGAISQWVINGRVPTEFCPQIELATMRMVRCEEMRPDVAWALVRAGDADLPRLYADHIAADPDALYARAQRTAERLEDIEAKLLRAREEARLAGVAAAAFSRVAKEPNQPAAA